MAERTVSVSEVFDSSRFTAYQYMVCGICFLVVLLDGFDLTVAGVALPKIADFLHSKPGALGLALSAGQFGPVIGAFLLGTLADRWGRKWMLLVSALIFGVFTAMTVTITSVGHLALYRFLAGIGLGGAVPSALALGSEYAPSRSRASLVTTIYAGIPAGALVGGLLASWLIPHLGWQSLFVLGGIAPLILCVIMMFFLPESLEFLVRRDKDRARIRRIVSRVSPELGNDNNARFASSAKKLAGVSLKHLFTEGRALTTIVWWAISILAAYLCWALVSWAPTLLRNAGATVQQYSLAFAAIMFGSICAAVSIGRLMDKASPLRVLQIGFVLAFFALWVFGLLAGSRSLATVIAMSIGCGLFIFGAQGGAFAAATLVYPPAIRGTGTGWVYAMGKAGGVIAPAAGGLLLTLSWSVVKICFWQAVIALVIAALLIVFHSHLKRAALEARGAGAAQAKSATAG
ncbi:MAG TPA: MFS transporter [Syntrophorhabdales bacterium]|nr:MFS transporter [Syntrophorhabdales bacterium]